ncbi:hypothetical protein NQ318_013745 [Aromia moschata]|uniref:Uncharacterized protein n=1 Tax=Aromia moschata TaxID=1265417 RepID=A0AAV8ZAR4_9CUCU|nr:hypothetical protein NQ318_013745 [Aromia moschata]
MYVLTKQIRVLVRKPKSTIQIFSCLSTSQTQVDLEKRRKEMMARGLPKQKPIKGVKHIVLVASGKGGVGKSTTSVNLATAMKKIYPDRGVGLLDTDVFGPSIPLMMNLEGQPFLTNEGLMEPLVNYGHVHGVLNRQICACDMEGADGYAGFGKINAPSGLGRTRISHSGYAAWNWRYTPKSCTKFTNSRSNSSHYPQSAALQVTKRGAIMFKKLNVPLIGIVENMSSVRCTSCSADIKIFGEGTSDLAKELGCDILAKFPLNQEISSTTDKGVPIVLENRDGFESSCYKKIAEHVVEFLKCE